MKAEPNCSLTDGFGCHGDQLVIPRRCDPAQLPLVLRRVTGHGRFLPAHVASHHVAQGQHGAVLGLWTLRTNK